MSKYYHGTSYNNFRKIINDGKIKHSIEGGVYLAKSKEDALKFVFFRFCNEDVAIIEMDLDDNYIEETFDHDEGFFKCKAYIYKGDVTIDNTTNYWKCPAFQTSTNLND